MMYFIVRVSRVFSSKFAIKTNLVYLYARSLEKYTATETQYTYLYLYVNTVRRNAHWLRYTLAVWKGDRLPWCAGQWQRPVSNDGQRIRCGGARHKNSPPVNSSQTQFARRPYHTPDRARAFAVFIIFEKKTPIFINFFVETIFLYCFFLTIEKCA